MSEIKKLIRLLKRAHCIIKEVGDGNWKDEDVKWQDIAMEWQHDISEYIILRKKRIFLGGTCNDSIWREDFIKLLNTNKLAYFNPVVDDWNEEAQKNELLERVMCDFCIYTITPKMTGVYSIAEVIDDSNKRPEKTILILLKSDDDFKHIFPIDQWKSLEMVVKMVKRNGGRVYYSLESAAEYLNAIGEAK
jgi:hypothetical protein